MILSRLSGKQSDVRSVITRYLFLQHVNILEVFEILVAVVICFHKFLDLSPDLLLNLRVFGQKVDGHFQVVGCGVCPCHKKSRKLSKNLVFFIYQIFFLIVVFLSKNSLK